MPHDIVSFPNQNCDNCLYVGSTLSADILAVRHMLLSLDTALTRDITIYTLHEHAGVYSPLREAVESHLLLAPDFLN